MLRNIWQTISGIACCAILHPFLCGSSLGQADPLGIVFPNTWVGNIDKIEFNEPSGIVFHRARGTLFVVGDGGDICEIETDGTLIQQKHIRRADFEGITYDPSTGLLYVAIEGEEKIVEFEPEGLAEIRAFAIQRTFEGEMRLKPGGSGIEAITFVPDSGHPHGGTFMWRTKVSISPREMIFQRFSRWMSHCGASLQKTRSPRSRGTSFRV